MASLLNPNGTEFTKEVIEIYGNNKVGQFSKFIDKTAIAVTYFPINQACSMVSKGTAGQETELGSNSPTRYNQINNFPLFNLPILELETELDESGLDVNMEYSDIIALPDTIKPNFGDYILLQLPGCPELMFRVNNFKYNTIKSNDYYSLSIDIKYIAQDDESLIEIIKNQVIDVYETIYDNIGTNDKCFVLTEDYEKLKDISKLYNELSTFYKDIFYDKDLDVFVCKNYKPEATTTTWFYDMNVENFITQTEIYYNSNIKETIVLSNQNDLKTSETELKYKRSLYYAVANRVKHFLSEYLYTWNIPITIPFSIFNVYHKYVEGVNLHVATSLINNDTMLDYFDKELILAIKYYGETYPYDVSLLSEDVNTEPDNNESTETYIYTPKTYLDEIIYNFMLSDDYVIDSTKLIDYMLDDSVYAYQTMPIIIYIVYCYYQTYFNKINNS